jgi:hypothetical protein
MLIHMLLAASGPMVAMKHRAMERVIRFKELSVQGVSDFRQNLKKKNVAPSCFFITSEVTSR